ncbi:glycosyltransferase family 4 protein [Candidatus Woesearchaeota archaeon]|nr:glycosyltransferase family 4 protein [Candidatus Woesearchaeota archaeon]
MKVLMFGWEFAPVYSGGLGVACAGLVKAMVAQGADVTFVLPRVPDGITVPGVKLISADRRQNKLLKFKTEPLTAYASSESYELWKKRNPQAAALYGNTLFAEVQRYAEAAKELAAKIPHDVIHSHDWMTYQAGINAKAVSGKPLVVHVHATEFDRTGGNSINQHVYGIEKLGFENADAVVPVSNFTKEKVVANYGIDPEKIMAVHNAVEFTEPVEQPKLGKTDKVVLFLGRITLQKGPDWFLYAAKKVLEKEPRAKFIMAGSGDMEPKIIEKAAELGLAGKMLFTGFLTGKDIDRAYKMADVYVMPSVSEPFGITPLEAMRNGTPVIISKQSGVSEVVKHCLKVDFWDVHAMANKILGVLYYKELQDELGLQGRNEVANITWDKPAHEVLNLYGTLMKKRRR